MPSKKPRPHAQTVEYTERVIDNWVHRRAHWTHRMEQAAADGEYGIALMYQHKLDALDEVFADLEHLYPKPFHGEDD